MIDGKGAYDFSKEHLHYYYLVNGFVALCLLPFAKGIYFHLIRTQLGKVPGTYCRSYVGVDLHSSYFDIISGGGFLISSFTVAGIVVRYVVTSM